MAFFESEKTGDTPEEESAGGGRLFCHDRSGSKVPIAESKSAPSIFHHKRTCRSSHTHPPPTATFPFLSFPFLGYNFVFL